MSAPREKRELCLTLSAGKGGKGTSRQRSQGKAAARGKGSQDCRRRGSQGKGSQRQGGKGGQGKGSPGGGPTCRSATGSRQEERRHRFSATAGKGQTGTHTGDSSKVCVARADSGRHCAARRGRSRLDPELNLGDVFQGPGQCATRQCRSSERSSPLDAARHAPGTHAVADSTCHDAARLFAKRIDAAHAQHALVCQRQLAATEHVSAGHASQGRSRRPESVPFTGPWLQRSASHAGQRRRRSGLQRAVHEPRRQFLGRTASDHVSRRQERRVFRS